MKKDVLLFPGQNSLNIEKAREAYDNNKIVRESICISSNKTNLDIPHALLHDERELYHSLELMSVLIFALSTATFQIYMAEGAEKQIVLAGHSLGEISALACADVFSYDDALQLVVQRARIAKKIDGNMFVITNIHTQHLESMCKSARKEGLKVWICCYNGAKQNCIAGAKEDIKYITDVAEGLGGRVVRAKGVPAYHCNIMEPGRNELRKYLTGLKISKPKYPVLSGAYAVPYADEESVIRYLSDQLTMPVQWTDIAAYIERINISEYIEMGYSHILSNLIRHSTMEER